MQIGDRVRVVGLSTPYTQDWLLGEVGALQRILSEDVVREIRCFGATHVVSFEDGDIEYLFRASDVRLERDAQEPFWQLYHERRMAHHGEARRRANRACNLWRCHEEAKATELARSCHTLNLIFSAMAEPHGWRRSRISMNDLVELCREAGKSDRETADFLYHIRLGGRPIATFEGLLLRCTCMAS